MRPTSTWTRSRSAAACPTASSISTRRPQQNLADLAKAKKVDVADLVVCILDRPRHAELIAKVREAGARIMLIGDGDVSGVIATSTGDSGIDIYMGSGGAPEGVLAAAALRAIGGQIQGRLLFRNDDEKAPRPQVGHHRPQPQILDARHGQGRRDVRGDRRHLGLDAEGRAPLRQRRGDAFHRDALEDRHGAVDLRPSQFLDQDWPAELGVIMMAGCGAALIACVLALLAVHEAAAEDGCRQFAWSVERELELFADGFVVDVESEPALPKDGVFSLLLQPVAAVIYLVPPERGRDDGLGGVVTLEWISAGRYQVTLSGEAWIDAVQNERRLPMLASTGRNDCPGVRQSVQFEVDSVPLTLQFGGATIRRLNIAVLRIALVMSTATWAMVARMSPQIRADARPSSASSSSLTGRRWAARLGDERMALAMAQRHGLPDAICRLLAAREVDLEGVPDFLEPTLRKFLPDPLHLKDMDAAVARLVRAVREGERIVVFGDYDVDGATSSALLLRFFRSVGGNIGVYIPDRRKEGYGPNAPALLKLKEEGAAVVVTVDCGVTAFEPLAEAQTRRPRPDRDRPSPGRDRAARGHRRGRSQSDRRRQPAQADGGGRRGLPALRRRQSRAARGGLVRRARGPSPTCGNGSTSWRSARCAMSCR